MHRWVVVCACTLWTSSASAQLSTRESVDERGFELPEASIASNCSDDGRYVLVALRGDVASNTPPAVWNRFDLYVRDRVTGALDWITPAHDGARADASTENGMLTPDARFVVFGSYASNLVAGDTNGTFDAFLRDRLAGTTECISVSPAGGSANGRSLDPTASSDGRWVAFWSEASDLVVGDTNGVADIFVRDRWTATTALVSRSASGVIADQASYLPAISRDGALVVFSSQATNLIDGVSLPVVSRIYLREFASGAMELVSVGPGGADPNGGCVFARMSNDGTAIVFGSYASNLHPLDTDTKLDIFVRDRATGTTDLITQPTALEPDEFVEVGSAISNDGRYVLFASSTTAFAVFDPNNDSDVLLRDRLTGATVCISCRQNGHTGPNYCDRFDMSGDGRWVVFTTRSPNLVFGDTNGTTDAFVRDASITDAPIVWRYCSFKANSAGCAPRISSNGKASLTEPMSLFVVAFDVLTQSNGRLLWGLASSATPFHGGTLCIAAPYGRLPMQNAAGSAASGPCEGRLSTRFDAALLNVLGLAAGTTVYTQYYYRDPGFTDPNNIGLTDALRFEVSP